jgi:hypothetical protein
VRRSETRSGMRLGGRQPDRLRIQGLRAARPAAYPPTLPSAAPRAVTGWGGDTAATIEPGHAHNPTDALARGTLTHGGLACRTGHLTRGGRGIHKRTVDCGAPTGISLSPLDTFRDCPLLLHRREHVWSAIGMPRVVVVECLRRGEAQQKYRNYTERCSTPHRLLLLGTVIKDRKRRV